MFKNLVDVSGFETLATIATVALFVAFVAVVVRVLLLRKDYITEMENLPLDSSDTPPVPRED